MKQINVIDLDKTLIPYDSFGLLIKNEILKFNFYIIYQTFFRVLRFIDNAKFKENITKYLQKKKESYFVGFVNKIYDTIDENVLKLINDETNENTINILVSASPNIYVKLLIQKLNWKGSGSYFNEKGKFIHLYKEGKIYWIKENFNKYDYHFAISDSDTDNELLNMFKKKKKWILQ